MRGREKRAWVKRSRTMNERQAAQMPFLSIKAREKPGFPLLGRPAFLPGSALTQKDSYPRHDTKGHEKGTKHRPQRTQKKREQSIISSSCSASSADGSFFVYRLVSPMALRRETQRSVPRRLMRASGRWMSSAGRAIERVGASGVNSRV